MVLPKKENNNDALQVQQLYFLFGHLLLLLFFYSYFLHTPLNQCRYRLGFGFVGKFVSFCKLLFNNCIKVSQTPFFLSFIAKKTFRKICKKSIFHFYHPPLFHRLAAIQNCVYQFSIMIAKPLICTSLIRSILHII